MQKKRKESFFWTSYSDLTTSLFFIMLVLFVAVVVFMNGKMREIKASLEEIERLNNSIKTIDTRYFDYNEEFMRHTLKDITVWYPKDVYDINRVTAPETTLPQLENVGKVIVQFLERAKDSIPNAQYMIIIEGQASKDQASDEHNYNLSYKRALSLVDFWRNKGIDFGEYNNGEVLISGSGTKSPFRDSIEKNNQRFVIHIIPKPGLLDKQ